MTKEQAFVGDRIALWNGTVHGAGGTEQHEVLISVPVCYSSEGRDILCPSDSLLQCRCPSAYLHKIIESLSWLSTCVLCRSHLPACLRTYTGGIALSERPVAAVSFLCCSRKMREGYRGTKWMY
jgi:hypothetical protein